MSFAAVSRIVLFPLLGILSRFISWMDLFSFSFQPEDANRWISSNFFRLDIIYLVTLTVVASVFLTLDNHVTAILAKNAARFAPLIYMKCMYGCKAYTQFISR